MTSRENDLLGVFKIQIIEDTWGKSYWDARYYNQVKLNIKYENS